MKTDLYTKIILTVIAVSLTLIVVQNMNIITPVQAWEDPTAKASGYAVVPLNVNGEIDVNIKSIDTYDMMPVKIKDVDTYDELNVNLKEVGGSSVSQSSGKLNVRVD